MREDNMIAVRDQVDVYVDKGIEYKAHVEDISKEGYLITPMPSHAGALMPLSKGQTVKIAYYRQSGRFVADAKVKGVKTSKKASFAYFQLLSNPVKEQRRNFFRLSVALKAHICAYPDNDAAASLVAPTGNKLLELAKTKDISISGVSLISRTKYQVGDRYLLKIFLDWPTPSAAPLTVCGEVRRLSFNRTNGTYQTGFHFIDHNESVGEFIGKFILVQQQNQIRQRRLIEG